MFTAGRLARREMGGRMCSGNWRSSGRAGSQQGFTYVAVLAAIVLMSLALAAIGPQWAQDAQREREKELIRVGTLYAMAIDKYHRSSPGSVRQFPPTLEALLEDRRLVGTHRHLRKLYADPMDPARPWGLMRAPDGGVRGVFSTSQLPPLRTQTLDLGLLTLPAARSYEEWKFTPNLQP